MKLSRNGILFVIFITKSFSGKFNDIKAGSDQSKFRSIKTLPRALIKICLCAMPGLLVYKITETLNDFYPLLVIYSHREGNLM